MADPHGCSCGGWSEPTIINEVKEWAKKEKGCLYLYTFQIASKEVDLSALVSAYSEAKKAKKGGRAYAKLNKPSAWLYVGESQHIHQRLKEHLGFGAKGTYALHLAYWANSIGIQLNFECAKYPSDTSRVALQALEDTLWEELKPMFGRQGVR
jgi:hypothetical protein